MAKTFNCALCQDEWVLFDDNGDARQCGCVAKVRIQKLFKASHITPAFSAKTFANFDIKGKSKTVASMFHGARKYAMKFNDIKKTEHNWLLMCGQPGSGKTHLSMAIANELLHQSIPVLYIPHVEIINELLAGMRRDEDISTKTQGMKTAPVLIWDDLWKQFGDRPQPFELKLAFEVINYRYLHCLPTIINTEREPKNLVMIDEATGSRMIERARGNITIVSGIEANYRLKIDKNEGV